MIVFDLAYALGFILGLLVVPAIATAGVYGVCRLLGRKMVREEIRSVYLVSLVAFVCLSIAGLFVE
jgi:hypothetical protein